MDDLFGEELKDSYGSFFMKDGELIANVMLEFNVSNLRYREFITRLIKLVREAEECHVLKSSSGI